MRQWQGRRYWLVGATGELGRAIAQHLSRAGVRLVLSARDADALDGVAATLPGQAEVAPLDLRDGERVAQVAAGLGAIDGLVVLTGLCPPGSRPGEQPEDALATVETALLGAMRLTGAVVPGMMERGRGHVVLCASGAGRRGRQGALGHGTAAAGLIHLAETLRGDVAGRGVDIQIVTPAARGTSDPATAAQNIFEAMTTDTFRHDFPLAAGWIGRAGRLVPDWLWYRATGGG